MGAGPFDGRHADAGNGDASGTGRPGAVRNPSERHRAARRQRSRPADADRSLRGSLLSARCDETGPRRDDARTGRPVVQQGPVQSRRIPVPRREGRLSLGWRGLVRRRHQPADDQVGGRRHVRARCRQRRGAGALQPRGRVVFQSSGRRPPRFSANADAHLCNGRRRGVGSLHVRSRRGSVSVDQG